MKTCTKCKIEKPLSEFSKSGSRVQSSCKPCRSAQFKKYCAENPEKVKATREKFVKANNDKIKERKKAYRAKNQDKIKEYWKEYYAKNSTKLNESRREKGREYYAKNSEALKAYQKAYKADNADKVKARNRTYRALNTAKMKEYRINNADRIKAVAKAYHESNRERLRPKKVSRVRLRQVKKTQATPLWANLKKIDALYAARDRVSRCLGIKMHVDHIIPLQNPKVCGLHVFENLQIISAKANMAKHNKFEQDPC
jgi:hypothetical protein